VSDSVLLSQFLTNVFFIPYMALRQFGGDGKPNLAPPGLDPARLPPYAAAIGVAAAAVGLVTFFWVPLALPDQFGGLADRYNITSWRSPVFICLPFCSASV
jgi:hypothetical protein